MKEYRKTATVKAKIFEKGDESGYIENTDIPFVSTMENQAHKGKFGEQYLCIGVMGERWLVDKDIFERTYEEVQKQPCL